MTARRDRHRHRRRRRRRAETNKRHHYTRILRLRSSTLGPSPRVATGAPPRSIDAPVRRRRVVGQLQLAVFLDRRQDVRHGEGRRVRQVMVQLGQVLLQQGRLGRQAHRQLGSAQLRQRLRRTRRVAALRGHPTGRSPRHSAQPLGLSGRECAGPPTDPTAVSPRAPPKFAITQSRYIETLIGRAPERRSRTVPRPCAGTVSAAVSLEGLNLLSTTAVDLIVAFDNLHTVAATLPAAAHLPNCVNEFYTLRSSTTLYTRRYIVYGRYCCLRTSILRTFISRC